MSKLDRIGVRRDKLYAKRDEILKAIEDADKEYEAEENLEAGDILRTYKIKPQDLAKFLKSVGGGLPGNNVPEELLKSLLEPGTDEEAVAEDDDDYENDEEEDTDEKETY